MNIRKARLDYLDSAKGFAIILVVLGHIYGNDNPIKYWLHSFHVPIFFIISGILLKHINTESKNMKNIINSKFKNLIIPYFMFELICIFVYMIKNEFSFEVFKWNIMDTILLYTRAQATWFLVCIFVAEIIFILMKKYLKNDTMVISLSVILFMIPLLIHVDNHFIIVLFRILMANGFLCIGYYSYKFIVNLNLSNILVIILILINMVLGVHNGLVGMFGLVFNNKLIYVVTSIIGSISVIFLFKKIRPNKLLLFYGKNSLIILGTHGVVLSIIGDLLKVNFENYIMGIIILILTLMIEIPIVYLINNYLPWILGKFNEKSKFQTILEYGK